jgi:molecular chaperone DnaK
VLEGEDPTVLQNRNGELTTPSVVRFGEEWDSSQLPHVGEPALNKATANPDRTVQSVKREIGSDWTFNIDDATFTPEEISHFILRQLRQDASEALGVQTTSLTQAVITVPAYFTEPQRQATRDAATMAGFEHVSLLNEPSAAAMAYGYGDSYSGTLVVFDLGGGTFDVSVLEVSGNGFVVQATGGDRVLGGDDWDAALQDWVLDQFEQEHGIDATTQQPDESAAEYRMRMRRLSEQVKRTKHQLCSTEHSADLSIPMFMTVDGVPQTLDTRITPSRFEQETEHLLEQTTDPVMDALSEAGVRPEQVDDIILAGGATRMPQVRAHVRDLFGVPPATDLNPDQVVAQGAAVHAGASDVMYKELTPLTLGVELDSGLFDPLIERNTMLPATAEKRYTTVSDTQDTVQINVYQGERDVADENRQLREIYLTGLAPLGEGRVQIEVTFEVDRRGLLTVYAADVTPGHDGEEIETIIDDTANLSEAEVQAHLEQANEHAGRDQQRRLLAEAQRAAHSQVATTQQFLDEYGAQVGASQQEDLETALDQLTTLANGGTDVPGEIEEATEHLADLHSAAEQEVDLTASGEVEAEEDTQVAADTPERSQPEQTTGAEATTPEPETNGSDASANVSDTSQSGGERTEVDWGADASMASEPTNDAGEPAVEGKAAGADTATQGDVETFDLSDPTSETGRVDGEQNGSGTDSDQQQDDQLSGRAVEEGGVDTEHATANQMSESGGAGEYSGVDPAFASEDGGDDDLHIEQTGEAVSRGDGAGEPSETSSETPRGEDTPPVEPAEAEETTAFENDNGGTQTQSDDVDDPSTYDVDEVIGQSVDPTLDTDLPDTDSGTPQDSGDNAAGGETLGDNADSPVDLSIGDEVAEDTESEDIESSEGDATATETESYDGGNGWEERTATESVLESQETVGDSEEGVDSSAVDENSDSGGTESPSVEESTDGESTATTEGDSEDELPEWDI